MDTDAKKPEEKKYDTPVDLKNCCHTLKPLSPTEYGSMVTIIVGKDSEQRTFHVHEGLLKHHSAYFRAALKNEWEEGVTRTIKLPDDEPNIFAIYFSWLMIGKLYLDLDENGLIPLSSWTLCKAFVFGDTRGSLEFCNACIDCLCQKISQKRYIHMPKIKWIYSNTLPGSSLRKLMIHVPIANSTWDMRRFNLPAEFLLDLIETSVKLECVIGKRITTHQELVADIQAHHYEFHNHQSSQDKRP
ncbi:hypothetical protein BS50DRAFT_634349 [Corynespora cassiicola Philippines]|uniref:BTB domain-containing protein n=1 Tax=Corynespora cassiicola Philippines TaxID=1448308 RepID=A0A2T2NP93_CORCC|nr:hypothetical protein BS50DRAFT_634349 [Corynespora cassiicola Philippines]